MKSGAYERITSKIVADLETEVPPWKKPWNAEQAAGRITRPLRANGVPYRGINVLMLWGEATARDYAAPVWMTFRQALELNAGVRKGQRDRCSSLPTAHTHRDAETLQEIERDSDSLKYSDFPARDRTPPSTSHPQGCLALALRLFLKRSTVTCCA